MQIFVKSSVGSVAVQCLPTDKVEDVKCIISERTGLKEPELAYNGRVMEDVCTLDDYLVSEEATLEAYVPVLGGRDPDPTTNYLFHCVLFSLKRLTE